MNWIIQSATLCVVSLTQPWSTAVLQHFIHIGYCGWFQYLVHNVSGWLNLRREENRSSHPLNCDSLYGKSLSTTQTISFILTKSTIFCGWQWPMRFTVSLLSRRLVFLRLVKSFLKTRPGGSRLLDLRIQSIEIGFEIFPLWIFIFVLRFKLNRDEEMRRWLQ